MKKSLLAVLLAAVLILSSGLTVLAEEGDIFEGQWIEPVAQRGVMDIELEDGVYKIEVAWPSSAFERSVWHMTGTYDEEQDAIVYKTGSYSVHVFSEDGSFTEEDQRIGIAGVIALRNGRLYWIEAGSPGGEPSVFVRPEMIEAGTAVGAERFDDVSFDDYFYEAVDWALYKGITDGRSYNVFAPDGSCKRSETVTFLWRYAGEPEADGSASPFTDLEKGSWYEQPVFWAFNNKITDGVSAALFSPESTTTRAQVITFLYRVAGEPEVSVAAPFTDVAEGSWYEQPVAWAYNMGMLDEHNTPGLAASDGTRFEPDKPCRRADIVTFMYLAEGGTNGIELPEPPAAEEPSVYPDQFVGQWMDRASGRASMEILPRVFDDYDKLDVSIHWGGSASESYEWNIEGQFDAQSGKLVYTGGRCLDVIYDEEGEVSESEVVYEGSSGSFSFENGLVYWNDDMEERSPEMVFEPLPGWAPEAESLVSEYFEIVAGCHPGTAGSSLKQAEAFEKTVGFADKNDLWCVNLPVFREEMLKAWESLSEEDRGYFDESIMGLVSMGPAVFDNYDSVKDVFEDAGVGDAMQALRGSVKARMSWEVLISNTMTLGNSDD